MRPLYFLLKLSLPLAYSVFFRKKKLVNAPKKLKARTILVANHPSAFLDPPMIATMSNPIVYFMTRSDVFKWWLKPVTWACHMVPIYRAEQDGAGTYEKNQKIFKGIRKVLNGGGSLIMFGEGYTDNIFIRSLKPMKKGPPRIGFGAMDATNWELDIKMQAVGVNYTNPGKLRSEILISYGDPIPLKEYKELYDENPNKATLQLMRRLGEEIKANITYIDDKSKADFLEQLLILSRKGMNHKHYDTSIKLHDKMLYSQALAKRINEEYQEGNQHWTSLEENVGAYFNELEKKKIDEKHVFQFSKNNGKSVLKNWLILLLTLPIFLLGFVHMAIPYLLTKTMVEKMFKRSVFWSGVKLKLGAFIAILFNLPIYWLFPSYVYPELQLELETWQAFLITFTYMVTVIPFVFTQGYKWKRFLTSTLKLGSTKKNQLEEMSKKRQELLDQMEAMNITYSKS